MYPVESVDLSGREDLGTWNVAVPRKQKPRFVSELGTTAINPGKVATIRAEVEGYPSPRVEWFCNGKKLLHDGLSVIQTVDGGVQTLQLSGNLFSSEILCVARNSAGVATSVGNLNVIRGIRRIPWTSSSAYDAFDSPQKPSSSTNRTKDSPFFDYNTDSRESSMPPRFLVEMPYLNRVAKGSQIILPAKISKTPNTKVVWYQNGKRVRDDFKHSTVYSVQQDHLICNLIIRDADFKDSGTYLCRAVNANGECHMKVSVKVERTSNDYRRYPTWGQEPPSTLKEIGTPPIPKLLKVSPMQPYIEQKNVHSEIALESTEDTSVVWYQDGKKIGEDSRKRVTLSVIDLEHKSSLDIMNVTAGDEATYKVHAFNTRGAVQYESNLNLNKFEYSKPFENTSDKKRFVHRIYEDEEYKSSIDNKVTRLTRQFSDMKVIKPAPRRSTITPEAVDSGQPVKLDVSLKNISPDSKLIWYKDGSRVYEDKSRVFTVTEHTGEQKTSSLFIAYVTPEDTGLWTCKVKRPGGHPPVRRTTHISVPPIIRDAHLINPQFTSTPKTVRQVTEYASAQFDVQLHAHPDTTIAWYKDGEKVNEDTRTRFHYTIDNESIASTLHLKNVSVADEGHYTIKAISPDGKSMEYSTELKVTEWTRPYTAPIIEKAKPQYKTIQSQTSQIDFQIRGTPDTKVVWYKDGQVFNEDHRRKIVMNVHEDKITSSLVILNTEEVDKGQYTVRAVNAEGECELKSELKVMEYTNEIRPVGKPKREVIVPQFTKAQMDATFVATDNTKVVWFKGGKPIKEDFRKKVVLVQQDEHLHSSLVIAQPTPEDAGEYVAHAISKEGEEVTFLNVLCLNEEMYHEEVAEPKFVTVAAPLEVIEVQPPSIVEEPLWPLSVDEASKLQLTGTVHGPFNTKVMWYKNDQPVVENDRTVVTETRIESRVLSTLVVENVSPDDVGTYTLKAWNDVGEDSASGPISVVEWTPELLQPVFLSPPPEEAEEILPRQTVVLDVRLHAHPDTKVTWFKDGTPVSEDSRIHSIHSVFDRHMVYTLLIDDVTVTDAGQYIVKAVSPVGQVAEHVSELTVSQMDIECFAPQFIGESSTTIEVKTGEIAQFNAQIEATADTSVTWFKDGVIIEEDHRKTITVATFERMKVACLSIVDVCQEDNGKYLLKAENQMGVATYTTELTVAPDETEDSFSFYLAPQVQQTENSGDDTKEFVEDRGLSTVLSSREAVQSTLVEKLLSDVQGISKDSEQDWDNLDMLENLNNVEHYVAGSLQASTFYGANSEISQSMLSAFGDEREDGDWEFDNDLDDVEPIYTASEIEQDQTLPVFSANEMKQSMFAFAGLQETNHADHSQFVHSVETEIVFNQTNQHQVYESTLNSHSQPEKPVLKALPVDTFVDWHQGNQRDWSFATEQPDWQQEISDFEANFGYFDENQSLPTAFAADAFQSWDLADEQTDVPTQEVTDASDVLNYVSEQKTETQVIVSGGISKFNSLEWEETNSDDGQHNEMSQAMMDPERRAESPPTITTAKPTTFGISAQDSIPAAEKANEILSTSPPQDNFTETEHYEAPLEVSVFSAAQFHLSFGAEIAETKLDSMLDMEETPLETLIRKQEESKPEMNLEENKIFPISETYTEESVDEKLEEFEQDNAEFFECLQEKKATCELNLQENLVFEKIENVPSDEEDELMDALKFLNVPTSVLELETKEEEKEEILPICTTVEVMEVVAEDGYGVTETETIDETEISFVEDVYSNYEMSNLYENKADILLEIFKESQVDSVDSETEVEAKTSKTEQIFDAGSSEVFVNQNEITLEDIPVESLDDEIAQNVASTTDESTISQDKDVAHSNMSKNFAQKAFESNEEEQHESMEDLTEDQRSTEEIEQSFEQAESKVSENVTEIILETNDEENHVSMEDLWEDKGFSHETPQNYVEAESTVSQTSIEVTLETIDEENHVSMEDLSEDKALSENVHRSYISSESKSTENNTDTYTEKIETDTLSESVEFEASVVDKENLEPEKFDIATEAQPHVKKDIKLEVEEQLTMTEPSFEICSEEAVEEKEKIDAIEEELETPITGKLHEFPVGFDWHGLYQKQFNAIFDEECPEQYLLVDKMDDMCEDNVASEIVPLFFETASQSKPFVRKDVKLEVELKFDMIQPIFEISESFAATKHDVLEETEDDLISPTTGKKYETPTGFDWHGLYQKQFNAIFDEECPEQYLLVNKMDDMCEDNVANEIVPLIFETASQSKPFVRKDVKLEVELKFDMMQPIFEISESFAATKHDVLEETEDDLISPTTGKKYDTPTGFDWHGLYQKQFNAIFDEECPEQYLLLDKMDDMCEDNVASEIVALIFETASQSKPFVRKDVKLEVELKFDMMQPIFEISESFAATKHDVLEETEDDLISPTTGKKYDTPTGFDWHGLYQKQFNAIFDEECPEQYLLVDKMDDMCEDNVASEIVPLIFETASQSKPFVRKDVKLEVELKFDMMQPIFEISEPFAATKHDVLEETEDDLISPTTGKKYETPTGFDWHGLYQKQFNAIFDEECPEQYLLVDKMDDMCEDNVASDTVTLIFETASQSRIFVRRDLRLEVEMKFDKFQPTFELREVYAPLKSDDFEEAEDDFITPTSAKKVENATGFDWHGIHQKKHDALRDQKCTEEYILLDCMEELDKKLNPEVSLIQNDFKESFASQCNTFVGKDFRAEEPSENLFQVDVISQVVASSEESNEEMEVVTTEETNEIELAEEKSEADVFDMDVETQVEHIHEIEVESEESSSDMEEYTFTVALDESKLEELETTISVQVEEGVLDDVVSLIVDQAIDELVEKLYSISVSEEVTELAAKQDDYDEIRFLVDTREAIDEQHVDAMQSSSSEESLEQMLQINVTQDHETIDRYDIKVETKDAEEVESSDSDLVMRMDVTEDIQTISDLSISEHSSIDEEVESSKVKIGINLDEEKYQEEEQTELLVSVSAEEKQSQFDIMVYDDQKEEVDISKVQIQMRESTKSEEVDQISCIVKQDVETASSTEDLVLEKETIHHRTEFIQEQESETETTEIEQIEKYAEKDETELLVSVSSEVKQSQFDVVVYDEEKEQNFDISKVQIQMEESTANESIEQISCIVKKDEEVISSGSSDEDLLVEKETVHHRREIIQQQESESSEIEEIYSVTSSEEDVGVEQYEVQVSQETREDVVETEIIIGEEGNDVISPTNDDVFDVESSSTHSSEQSSEEFLLHVITDDSETKPGSVEISLEQESSDHEEVTLVSRETCNIRVTESNIELLELFSASTADHFLLPAPLMACSSAQLDSCTEDSQEKAEALVDQTFAQPTEATAPSSQNSEKLEYLEVNGCASQEMRYNFEETPEQSIEKSLTKVEVSILEIEEMNSTSQIVLYEEAQADEKDLFISTEKEVTEDTLATSGVADAPTFEETKFISTSQILEVPQPQIEDSVFDKAEPRSQLLHVSNDVLELYSQKLSRVSFDVQMEETESLKEQKQLAKPKLAETLELLKGPQDVVETAEEVIQGPENEETELEIGAEEMERSKEDFEVEMTSSEVAQDEESVDIEMESGSQNSDSAADDAMIDMDSFSEETDHTEQFQLKISEDSESATTITNVRDTFEETVFEQG